MKRRIMFVVKNILKMLAPAGLAAAITAAALSIVSCSVKEDRDVCPAYLTVRSDGHVGEDGFTADIRYVVTPTFGGDPRQDDGTLEEFTSEGRTFRVPRKKTVNVEVYTGLSDMTITDTLLRITPGKPCDAFLCGTGSAWLPADLGDMPLPLNRNYAAVTATVVGDVYYPYPYAFVVKGGVDGFVIPGLRPHRGTFEHRALLGVGDCFRSRVPRQLDSSLQVELRTIDTDELVTVIPLGALVAERGYDWDAADLEDIELELDFARALVTIYVNDWVIRSTLLIVI